MTAFCFLTLLNLSHSQVHPFSTISEEIALLLFVLPLPAPEMEDLHNPGTISVVMQFSLHKKFEPHWVICTCTILRKMLHALLELCSFIEN